MAQGLQQSISNNQAKQKRNADSDLNAQIKSGCALAIEGVRRWDCLAQSTFLEVIASHVTIDQLSKSQSHSTMRIIIFLAVFVLASCTEKKTASLLPEN